MNDNEFEKDGAIYRRMPHGGAILVGGAPGNRGGTGGAGRPTSALRQRWKKMFCRVVLELEHMDISKLTVSDKLKLLDISGRYAFPGGVMDEDELAEIAATLPVKAHRGRKALPAPSADDLGLIGTTGYGVAFVIEWAARGKSLSEIFANAQEQGIDITEGEIVELVSTQQKRIDLAAGFTDEQQRSAYLNGIALAVNRGATARVKA